MTVAEGPIVSVCCHCGKRITWNGLMWVDDNGSYIGEGGDNPPGFHDHEQADQAIEGE